MIKERIKICSCGYVMRKLSEDKLECPKCGELRRKLYAYTFYIFDEIKDLRSKMCSIIDKTRGDYEYDIFTENPFIDLDNRKLILLGDELQNYLGKLISGFPMFKNSRIEILKVDTSYLNVKANIVIQIWFTSTYETQVKPYTIIIKHKHNYLFV